MTAVASSWSSGSGPIPFPRGVEEDEDEDEAEAEEVGVGEEASDGASSPSSSQASPLSLVSSDEPMLTFKGVSSFSGSSREEGVSGNSSSKEDVAGGESASASGSVLVGEESEEEEGEEDWRKGIAAKTGVDLSDWEELDGIGSSVEEAVV
jgi:hypothetical protein